jgi:hypothetical protein
MLVPSIETGSSDALADSSRATIRHNAYGDFEQDSYPRFGIERRRHSPESRQVIIIEDDSPHRKRRRVVQGDDPSRFRPLPSHDQRVLSTAPRVDSYLIPASSVHPRDFLIHQPKVPSQSGQGLFRDRQPPLDEPAPEHQVPIYNVPAGPGYSAPRPGHLRRVEAGFGADDQREMSHMRQISSPKPFVDSPLGMGHIRRPVNNVRAVERESIVRHLESDFGQRGQIQQLPLPSFSAQDRVSRSFNMGPDPVVADQAFIQNFSQSRIDPSLSQTRDGFTILPESSHQSFVIAGNTPQRYEDSFARSSTAARYGQERSHVQYLERPT